jgi:hypothetical protein
LNETIAAIHAGAPMHNQAVARVLSTWLNCTLRVFNNCEQTSFTDYSPSSAATDTITVLQVGSQFHSLIDVETLSTDTRLKLHICLKMRTFLVNMVKKVMRRNVKSYGASG